ncbi:MAG: hypothetical protein B6U76_04130 [Desulfurococcales archaeon ex4484_217_2]|nr:MAG: hypothetical protein B6U76_04130 [Desulfurococcales archaeon ex4484_217_2]
MTAMKFIVIPTLLGLGFGLLLHAITGTWFFPWFFTFIGFLIGLGLHLELIVGMKGYGRIAVLWVFTLFFWLFLFIYMEENMQYTQFIYCLYSGLYYGAFIHVLAAKIIGPLFFGRGFCGWGCWNASAFDTLGLKRKVKPIKTKLVYLKYFIALLWALFTILIAVNYFQQGFDRLDLIIIENILIYTLGLGLGYVFGHRFYCRTICPYAALMSLISRLSLLKIEGNPNKCIDCGICENVCPMGIPIRSFIKKGVRISNGECIMCLTCVRACPKGVLKPTFKLPSLKEVFSK